MEKISYKYLNFIPFTNFDLWDVKRYTRKSISSKYEVIPLSECIREQQKKYKLDEEEREYGILGVNNQEGIFDAYLQKGKEINQPYKKMEEGWIAYNPYRINVGSIGIKLKEHLYEYISPAYVVFSCLDNILPKYLFLLFKSETFNKVIRESTTGSVRQNLTIESLKNIKIPLPSLAEQEAIVNAYENKINQADQLENQADQLEIEIENYLFSELGIEKPTPKKEKIKGLQFVQFKDLERWDGKKNDKLNSLYRIEKMGKYIQDISTGTTPPTIRKEYFEGDVNFYTPSDLGEDMFLSSSERKISNLALKDKKSRRFEKGTILFVGIGSTIGKVGIVENNYASSNQQITGFFIDDNYLINSYVYYYFDYFKHITTKEQTKATIPIVNQEKILNILIPIPPLEKQQEIVDYISALKVQIKDKKNTAEQLKHQAQTDFENQIFS